MFSVMAAGKHFCKGSHRGSTEEAVCARACRENILLCAQVTLVQRRATSNSLAGGSGAAAAGAVSLQAGPPVQEHVPPGYAGNPPPGYARTPPRGRPRLADPGAPAAALAGGVRGWSADVEPDQAAAGRGAPNRALGGDARHAERQLALSRLAAAGAPVQAQAAGLWEPDQAGARPSVRRAAQAPVGQADGGPMQREPDRGWSEGASHTQNTAAARHAAAPDGAAGPRAGAAWHPERAALHMPQHSHTGPGALYHREHEAPQPWGTPPAGTPVYSGRQGIGAQPAQQGQGYPDPDRWHQAAGGGAQALRAQPPASQQPDSAEYSGAAAGPALQPQWQAQGGVQGGAGGLPWQAQGGAQGGPGAPQPLPWAWQGLAPQALPMGVPVVQVRLVSMVCEQLLQCAAQSSETIRTMLCMLIQLSRGSTWRVLRKLTYCVVSCLCKATI